MDEKLIIIMCGLPARGKSYITRKISNYLDWLNINNKVFNVGTRRRINDDSNHNADFFNPELKENVLIRDQLALNTLNELLNYLNNEDGKVAIFDATNTTNQRRVKILNHINQNSKNLKVLFLESICTNEKIIEENIKLKLNGPDYINIDQTVALLDFKKRINNYELCYEPISKHECELLNAQYLKIINIINLESFNINGFLPMILFNFLKNFNINNKNIWLTSNNNLNEILTNLPINNSLKIYSNIKQDLNLDHVHDLILEFENLKHENILIKTTNNLFLNGILKYFLSSNQFFEINDINFNNQIICINPKLYSVGFATFDLPIDSIDVDFIPSMTRSNSNDSNLIRTPICHELWQQFNYTNLNVTELSRKLEMLNNEPEMCYD